MLFQTLPLLTRDPCLSKDSCKKIATDIASVRVRYSHLDVTLDHEIVFCAGFRASKASMKKSANEIAAFDRTERRHLRDGRCVEINAVNNGKRDVSPESEQQPILQNLL